MSLVSFKIPKADGQSITITRKTDIQINIDDRVVLDSLKVKYYKWISIDITKRIKPYITGHTINLKGANYDKGTHKIELSGVMVDGTKFTETVVINVV